MKPIDLNELLIQESDSLSDHIEKQLSKSLKKELPQSNNESLTLSITNKSGQLLGGVTLHISYGWLLVKALWVDDDCRRLGLGQLLMQKAEQKALTFDCHSAWLDTSNPNALSFYQKLGYQPFGVLRNQTDQKPAKHRRWFLQKTLSN